MRALLVLVFAIGCTKPAVSPLAWWAGHWTGEHTEEHWTFAGGVLYGVGLGGDSFELMIVDDDGGLRFNAMPGGSPPVVFRAVMPLAVGMVTFTNPVHDDPTSIRYARRDDTLIATVEGAQRLVFTFSPMQHTAAPDLEERDRAAGKRVLGSGRRGTFAYTVGVAPHGSYATIWKQANSEWTVVFEAKRPIRSP